MTYVAIEPGIVFKIGDILRLLVSFAMPREAIDASTLPYPILPGRYDSMPTTTVSKMIQKQNSTLRDPITESRGPCQS